MKLTKSTKAIKTRKSHCPGSNPASIHSAVFAQALAMTSNFGLHSTRPAELVCPFRTFASFPSSARQT